MPGDFTVLRSVLNDMAYISLLVITLLSSKYAVPLLWIPRVCVLSGDRKAVLYVDLIITSAKSVLYTATKMNKNEFLMN